MRFILFEQIKSALKLLEVPKRVFLLPGVLGMLGNILRIVVFGLFIPLIQMLFADVDVQGLGRFSVLLDYVVGENPIPMMIGLLAMVSLVRSSSYYLSGVIINERLMEVYSRLQLLLIERHMQFGSLYYDITGLGSNVNKIEKLPRKSSRAVLVLHNMFVAMASLAIYFSVMILISWQLACLAVLFLLVYFIGFRRLNTKIELWSEQSEKADEQLSNSTHELFLNLPLIKLFNMQFFELKEWTRKAEKRKGIKLQERRYIEMVSPLKDLIGMIVLILFAWSCSQLMNTPNFIAVSQFILFFLVMRRSVGTFSDVLKFPDEWSVVVRNIDKVENLKSNKDKQIIYAGSKQVVALSGHFQFRELNFKYSGKRKALKNISCEIRKGRRTVICGSSGSGKSTLMRLILRLYDCPEGTIFLDNDDIRNYDISTLHAGIAYAGSNPLFFNDTIRYNVTYGLDGVSDDQLNKAAEQAGILSFIHSLKKGFDEEVGEGGKRLSGGEKQRLGLMRVFLRNADIILLDEATSALDVETENQIMQELSKSYEGKTIVMISHSLSFLKEGDHIIMLHEGKVIEQGNCAFLLKNENLFYKAWMAGGHQLPDQSLRKNLTE